MAEGDEQAEQNERLLNVLGQLLMRRVRDAAIRDWDAILGGRMRSAWSRWVQKRLESLTEEQRAQVQDLVPDIVDTTLHHLLCTLEQADSVAVGVRASGAAVADNREAAAGDLHGYLSAWVSRFSAERHGEPHPGPTVALARFAVLGLPDVLARRVTDDVHRRAPTPR